MKKGLALGITLLFVAATALQANAIGKTSITAYGTYWDGAEAGYGAGLKVSKSLIDMVYLDGRAGYLAFDTVDDMSMIPLEASINVGFPGMITPYAGIGAGYYIIDSAILENKGGYFGQLGIEFTIIKVGVMAELRYHDLEGASLDDLSANLGIQLKF